MPIYKLKNGINASNIDAIALRIFGHGDYRADSPEEAEASFRRSAAMMLKLSQAVPYREFVTDASRRLRENDFEVVEVGS